MTLAFISCDQDSPEMEQEDQTMKRMMFVAALAAASATGKKIRTQRR